LERGDGGAAETLLRPQRREEAGALRPGAPARRGGPGRLLLERRQLVAPRLELRREAVELATRGRRLLDHALTLTRAAVDVLEMVDRVLKSRLAGDHRNRVGPALLVDVLEPCRDLRCSGGE